MASVPPVPIRNPVVNPTDGTFNDKIVRFLNELRKLLSSAAQQLGLVTLENQGAAVSTTSIPTPDLVGGLYRVSFSGRITQAATVSSSLGVTLGWTTNSTSCTQAFTAVTGNTLASQTSGTINVSIDQGTPITYALSYASSGATPMLYGFDVWVEQIP